MLKKYSGDFILGIATGLNISLLGLNTALVNWAGSTISLLCFFDTLLYILKTGDL